MCYVFHKPYTHIEYKKVSKCVFLVVLNYAATFNFQLQHNENINLYISTGCLLLKKNCTSWTNEIQVDSCFHQAQNWNRFTICSASHSNSCCSVTCSSLFLSLSQYLPLTLLIRHYPFLSTLIQKHHFCFWIVPRSSLIHANRDEHRNQWPVRDETC